MHLLMKITSQHFFLSRGALILGQYLVLTMQRVQHFKSPPAHPKDFHCNKGLDYTILKYDPTYYISNTCMLLLLLNTKYKKQFYFSNVL